MNTKTATFMVVGTPAGQTAEEPVLAIILLTSALILVIALLAAAGAGKLARLDGASYPTALTRAAIAFTATLTLAAAIAAALAALR
ncbi:hypothetical protein [Streptomyces pseudovenezuelae]|uniref:hypothetical protein n=1 Tax=Streptomyces pseudovenezuelae TaxID=67350 RepID=UPI002E821B8D|nr:hypothetical protein [Streptomyces pseudovenezuelae]WUA85813.1 hypothetical protein OHO81_00145 [Streptomyces pseudovenezuelae]WUA93952.1 hypothetical protein OHO81_44465 [Streptomyces pseudovenezuelae]